MCGYVHLNVHGGWERYGFCRDGVTGTLEVPDLELISGPLQEQQAILTTQSSLQAPTFHFYLVSFVGGD